MYHEIDLLNASNTLESRRKISYRSLLTPSANAGNTSLANRRTPSSPTHSFEVKAWNLSMLLPVFREALMIESRSIDLSTSARRC
jgi:hypothetical protein